MVVNSCAEGFAVLAVCFCSWLADYYLCRIVIYIKRFKMRPLNKFSRAVLLCILFFITAFGSTAFGQSNTSDSLRVLCTKYDKSSGLDGMVTVSAILDVDSLLQPMYMIGDSVVNFFSDIKVSSIQKIHYITNKKLTKKFGKNLNNGVIILELKPGEEFDACQVLPDVENSTRNAFATKFSVADMDNTSGVFQDVANNLVESYGTDDEVFRMHMKGDPNACAILAVDSLNRKTFVKSFNDFRQGAIGDISAYDSSEAVKIIGDKGVNGLIIVLISSKYTLRNAIVSMPEKIRRRIRELEDVNLISLGSRAPIIIK